MNRNLTFIWALIITIGLFSNCEAQEKSENSQKNENNKTVANTSAQISRPADEAKIISNSPDYEIKETNLQYLQTLPIPEFKFVFETANNAEITPPDDAKIILENHWKEAMKFFYEEKQSAEKDRYWMRYCQKTHQDLQKVFVEAPLGKRKISQTESRELWGTLNKKAVELIREAENIK